MLIRKATAADTAAIVDLFDATHTEEEEGRTTIGWLRGIYPTVKVVETGLSCDDLYVMEDGGVLVAICRINAEQGECYPGAPWLYAAPPEQVLVLHTLIVAPGQKDKGDGSSFVAYYEEEARRRGAVGELTPVVRAGSSTSKDKATGKMVRYGTVIEAEIEQELF